MKGKGKNYEVSISREEMNAFEPERFEGEIVTVNDAEKAAEAIRELSASPVVGFDTETKPAFQKGQINRVALLQLATESKCFLIRLCKTGLTDEIKSFLENEDILKVGLSIKDDFHNLNRLSELRPGGFVDLQDYVKEFLITDNSLTKIHSIIFGKRISKNQQLSNWEAPSLTDRQKEYAALDAVACVNIYRCLREGGFKPEESKYYHEKPGENA